ncbi:MAG TPA: flagellar biosynthetic protein FliO [Phycisphaerae bacterium]|nr:flagellar biosynthetic protein FliO [Phycisphaerae bacterium]
MKRRLIVLIAALAAGLAGAGECRAQSAPADGEPNSRVVCGPVDVESRPLSRPSGSVADANVEGRRLNRDGAGVLDGWERTVLALAVVVAVVLGLRYLLKRFAGPGRITGRGGVIEVLARAAVLPRQHLLLVRMGRRLVLLGSAPGGLTTLAEITDPEEVAELSDAAQAGGAVESILKRKPGAEAETPPADSAQSSKAQDG